MSPVWIFHTLQGAQRVRESVTQWEVRKAWTGGCGHEYKLHSAGLIKQLVASYKQTVAQITEI